LKEKEYKVKTRKSKGLSRSIIGAVAGLSMIGLAACGGSSTTSESTDAATPETQETTAEVEEVEVTEDPIVIGFVTHVVGNPFIEQIIAAAEQAAEDLGVEIRVTGPAGADADAQLKAAQSLVAAGANGIAISVPSESMVQGLNQIVAGGVPVVSFNLLQAGVNGPYVGEKSVESGRILGQQVLDQLGGTSATGQVILGNCFPGFPVLENRAKGVQETMATAPGIEVLGPFDVKVDAAENYAKWEGLLSANPDAVALVGLCAPDIASLGKLKKANPNAPFIAGGYDLTAENLAAIETGDAQVSIGQTPFMQGYAPVYILVDAIRNGIDIGSPAFLDAGTEIVTQTEVKQPFNLPPLTFAELLEISASPQLSREYYQPLVDGVIPNWQSELKPIGDESS
jgi:ABC-type sugar transport system substrate-binding protein